MCIQQQRNRENFQQQKNRPICGTHKCRDIYIYIVFLGQEEKIKELHEIICMCGWILNQMQIRIRVSSRTQYFVEMELLCVFTIYQ